MDETAPQLQVCSTDTEVDVGVVSAGSAGLSAALAVAEHGRRVRVVDREAIGAGETARTSAHLTAALDDRCFRLEHWHGKDGACACHGSRFACDDGRVLNGPATRGQQPLKERRTAEFDDAA
jgi:nitrite reductase/ring-hydroxylating ferredoxin subunit